MAKFLQTYTSDICADNYKQIREILQALTEMCVGNPSNQQVILHKLVVDSINRILQFDKPNNDEESKKTQKVVSSFSKSGAKPKPHLVMVLEIKLKAVELLEVMLEDTCSDSQSIQRGLQYTVNKDSLEKTMVYFSRMSTHPDVVSWDMDDGAERGKFWAYHVMVALGHSGTYVAQDLLVINV